MAWESSGAELKPTQLFQPSPGATQVQVNNILKVVDPATPIFGFDSRVINKDSDN
jgi:hypothetical protein